MINGLEENDQKLPKTICHHMQCIFDPEMAKTAKARILDSSRCSFLQKNHQNLMRGFLDMV